MVAIGLVVLVIMMIMMVMMVMMLGGTVRDTHTITFSHLADALIQSDLQ